MRNAYKIVVEKPRKRDHLSFLGIDGRILLKYIQQIGHEGVYYIDLDQGTVKNKLHKIQGIS